MKRRMIPVLLLAAVALGAQTAEKPVAITSEPSHHLYLENEQVRVFQVEAAPHAATLIHQHENDYVFVSLGPSDIRNEVVGKAPVELKLEDGEVHWSKGGFAHRITNLSDQPFRNVTIELLRAQGAATPSTQPASRYCNPGSQTACVSERYLFCTEKVCVSDVTMGPGAATMRHSHATDHMVVAVTDVLMSDEIEGKAAVQRSLKAGEAAYIPAGITHRLVNGPQATRFITLQFK
jgi:quercetin dioxygenase-like cupin family protein